MKIRWVRIPLWLKDENRNSTLVRIDLYNHNERNSQVEVGHDASDASIKQLINNNEQ